MTPISACVAKVMSTVQEIKATGLSHVTSARQAASVAYCSLKEKGLKAYSAEMAAAARARASVALTDANTLAQAKAKLYRAKAVELKVATGELMASESFQATAASATGGATMLGAGGGAAGLAAYSKRDDIRKAASLVASTVGDGTVYVRGKASQSKTLLESAASGARARLVGKKKVD